MRPSIQMVLSLSTHVHYDEATGHFLQSNVAVNDFFTHLSWVKRLGGQSRGIWKRPCTPDDDGAAIISSRGPQNKGSLIDASSQ